jgi:Tol biopolymer transport system component
MMKLNESFFIKLVMICTLITVIGVSPVWAAFPGANGKIAMSYDRDIYVMNSDGTGLTNLTNNSLGYTMPDWSPDGTKIVFNTGGHNGDLYVMNFDGTMMTQLTSGTPNDYDPAWSPDGTQIAFVSNRDGYYRQIFIMNADGSDVTLLSDNDGQYRHVAWSPDGSKLAFSKKAPNESTEDIYSIKVNKTSIHKHLNTGATPNSVCPY